jgi:small subunit ribosomal protein S3
MSRRLDTRLGRLPLSTLQANIDYGFAQSFTTYGAIGVKVWIFRGMFGEVVEMEPVGGRRPRARGRR